LIELNNRSWDSVNEGDELPPLQWGPITVTHVIRDASGTRDLYPIHHDRDWARGTAGARDIFFNTQWYQGFLGRFVTEWGGPESLVRKLSFDMRGPNCPGDTITARGTVTRKYERDGMKLVDLDVRLDNQLSPDQVTARITLELV
jgi:acyl dehydratase